MPDQGATLNPAEIGRYLLQLRDDAGLRQSAVADKVKLSAAVLSRIETGERAATLDEVAAILTAIGTPQAAQLTIAIQRSWQVLPMPALDHVDQDILWEAEQIATQLEALRQDPEQSQAFGRRVGEFGDELKRCAGLLLKREHEVAFIGAIGVGKSTAICYLSDLTIKRDDGKLQPVLADGGGGTTLCEVHLIPGPEFGICIEPCTAEEIREDVRDLAEHLLRGTVASDAEGGSPSESQGTYREIARAIRNMASLNTTSSRDGEGKKVVTDPAKQLAQEVTSVRELTAEIVARMELHTRDRRQLWYEASSGKTPHAWLREEFRRINDGRNPEFTLPRRIDVIVKKQLLSVDGLSVRLIDTKGIHATAAREDLEVHLKDPHTLTVLCSAFGDAPGGFSQQLLGRAIDSGVRSLEVASSVLVLVQHDQALAMVDDATGNPAETVEEGYELKRDHALMNMAHLGLKGYRVGFYNCLSDKPELARQFLAEGLQRARAQFRAQLAAAVKGSKDLLENQLEQANQAALDEAASRLRLWVRESIELPMPPGSVQESLLAEIVVTHAAAVHAAARRNGEWRNFSYSYQLGFGARKLCVAAAGKRVDGFTDHCRILRLDPQLSPAREMVAQAERVLLAAFDQMQTKVQVVAQTSYREALKWAADLWQRCVAEWGYNRGYRVAVAQFSREWFTDEKRVQMERELRELLQREWERALESVAELVGPVGAEN